jgi:hypothetical protein
MARKAHANPVANDDDADAEIYPAFALAHRRAVGAQRRTRIDILDDGTSGRPSVRIPAAGVEIAIQSVAKLGTGLTTPATRRRLQSDSRISARAHKGSYIEIITRITAPPRHG